MKSPDSPNNFPKLLQQFFLQHLMEQRNVSPQTVAAYRDSFRLLFQFAQDHLGKTPERLALIDLDAPLILAFLNHLEGQRHNTVRTRNARFAAIRSFLRFAAHKDPTSLPVISAGDGNPDEALRQTHDGFSLPNRNAGGPRCS